MRLLSAVIAKRLLTRNIGSRLGSLLKYEQARRAGYFRLASGSRLL
jgi:hypothetical protein